MRIGYFLASEEFDPRELIRQASKLVSEDTVAQAVPCGPDLDLHLEAIGPYRDAGFDELYIQQIGSDQEHFFETYATEVLSHFNDSNGRASPVSSAQARPDDAAAPVSSGRTREQLYQEARSLGVEGRSRMNKSQLQRAVDNRKR